MTEINYNDDDDNNNTVLGHFTVEVPGANILLFSSFYFQTAH